MLANDMKKGMTGTLRNGWRFECQDNRKGIRRQLEVYGHFTETGDCFVWDILEVEGEPIELTPAQQKQYTAYHQMEMSF